MFGLVTNSLLLLFLSLPPPSPSALFHPISLAASRFFVGGVGREGGSAASSPASQINSGLDFPQTAFLQRVRAGSVCVCVCVGPGSGWLSWRLYFRTLQINCCTLTFKTSLIELAVSPPGCAAFDSSLFYQSGAVRLVGETVRAHYPVFFLTSKFSLTCAL